MDRNGYSEHLSVDFLVGKRLNGTKDFSRFFKRRDMGDLLLRILEQQQGRFVSGEAIGRRLGTSRAAVWKQIRTLRRWGPRRESDIRQRGERIVSVRTDFALVDKIHAQRGLRLR